MLTVDAFQTHAIIYCYPLHRNSPWMALKLPELLYEGVTFPAPPSLT